MPRAVEIKGPEQARDGEEEGAVGDVHAEAAAAAGAEDEVVALADVGVVGAVGGVLRGGEEAGWVEGAGGGVARWGGVEGPGGWEVRIYIIFR